MTVLQLNVDGQEYEFDEWSGTPLLWVLQVKLGQCNDVLPCGIDQCGDCTVYVDGLPVRSCKTPLSQVAGKRISLAVENAPPAPAQMSD